MNNWQDPRLSFLLLAASVVALVAVLAAVGVVAIAGDLRP